MVGVAMTPIPDLVDELAGEDVGRLWAWIVDGEIWDTGNTPAEAKAATDSHLAPIGAPELGDDGYPVCLMWCAPGRPEHETRAVLADLGFGNE
jgi:hypothetical protein